MAQLSPRRPHLKGMDLIAILNPHLRKNQRILVEDFDKLALETGAIYDFRVYNKAGEPQKQKPAWRAHIEARHRLKMEFNRYGSSFEIPYLQRRQLVVGHDQDFDITTYSGCGRLNGLWIVKGVADAAENKSSIAPRYLKSFSTTKTVQVDTLVTANNDADHHLSDNKKLILKRRAKRIGAADGEVTQLSITTDKKNRGDKW